VRSRSIAAVTRRPSSATSSARLAQRGALDADCRIRHGGPCDERLKSSLRFRARHSKLAAAQRDRARLQVTQDVGNPTDHPQAGARSSYRRNVNRRAVPDYRRSVRGCSYPDRASHNPRHWCSTALHVGHVLKLAPEQCRGSVLDADLRSQGGWGGRSRCVHTVRTRRSRSRPSSSAASSRHGRPRRRQRRF